MASDARRAAPRSVCANLPAAYAARLDRLGLIEGALADRDLLDLPPLPRRACADAPRAGPRRSSEAGWKDITPSGTARRRRQDARRRDRHVLRRGRVRMSYPGPQDGACTPGGSGTGSEPRRRLARARTERQDRSRPSGVARSRKLDPRPVAAASPSGWSRARSTLTSRFSHRGAACERRLHEPHRAGGPTAGHSCPRSGQPCRVPGRGQPAWGVCGERLRCRDQALAGSHGADPT